MDKIPTHAIPAGSTTWVVSTHSEGPRAPCFLSMATLADIGVVAAWKILKGPVVVHEYVAARPLRLVRLDKDFDVKAFHDAFSLEYRERAGAWDNYHTRDQLLGREGFADRWDGWFEAPSAEPGRPMGREVMVCDPAAFRLAPKDRPTTLAEIVQRCAAEVDPDRGGLYEDLRAGDEGAVKFAMRGDILVSVTKRVFAPTKT